MTVKKEAWSSLSMEDSYVNLDFGESAARE